MEGFQGLGSWQTGNDTTLNWKTRYLSSKFMISLSKEKGRENLVCGRDFTKVTLAIFLSWDDLEASETKRQI